MHSEIAHGDTRPSFWPRVREFAVPPSMIETATARRHAGDWAGACAAARVDVDLDLRSVARTHGHDLAARIRADLRHLAPDLLRWHLPRIAPDGLLRPGLTLALARYANGPGDTPDTGAGPPGEHPVHLVVRTPPAWADAGQRISLALWAGPGAELGAEHCPHPRPRPHPRFRLDLHRHLWDARRSGELRVRSGADQPTTRGGSGLLAAPPDLADDAPSTLGAATAEPHWAVDRWAAEAAILLRAEGRAAGTVAVRLGVRQRLLLAVDLDDESTSSTDPGLAGEASYVHEAHLQGAFDHGAFGARIVPEGAESGGALPVLPDAATWVPPDLALLRAGLTELDRLHPLVAAALAPDGYGPAADAPAVRGGTAVSEGRPRLVECRGALHRIGLVDGVLSALDHDPAEIAREELLASLTGTALPCLRAIDDAHRRPACLPDVRARLDHGDLAGALAAVEALLGPEARLRGGALRDELEAAARRRISHGLFRAGLFGPGPGPMRGPVPSPAPAAVPRNRRTPRPGRAHPRHTFLR
ncbi:hypothetical protein SAMN05216223_104191 [Actinacidiphila yanglinensis]|uniref:Uncharacterized protein n=1 Tax=Actinacidiphila yanglinensis TaxID=310779 RepID=A0A1H5YYN4_9ACTN|nr:hypothetical protein [Actinacidiphila yanglinensis]SEG28567.1 hypothetical protein SAMN05216223_104191 [Actinacidiphila yanglinensis]